MNRHKGRLFFPSKSKEYQAIVTMPTCSWTKLAQRATDSQKTSTNHMSNSSGRFVPNVNPVFL